MSRARLLIAALTTMALVVLISWQIKREQQVKACIEGGGLWQGPQSACKHRLRPILQRDLHRS